LAELTAEADASLRELLRHLAFLDYRFVTPTPWTHRLYLARERERRARDLRDMLGWNLPFTAESVDERVVALLRRADMLEKRDGLLRSKVRVSSLDGHLFLHSAFPTDGADAVFFGPDSYRFARFLRGELAGSGSVRHLVDIGAGAGAGAIACADLVPGARLTFLDTNPLALRFARINARHAGLEVATVRGSGLDALAEPFDLAIANPPFMADPAKRAYRDGGGMHGASLSLDWAGAAARRLAPGGRMLLYTASAIVAGEDRLEAALCAMLPALGCTLRYQEIDPDIFGEQLAQPGYEEVERIAAIGAVIETCR
jgi:methylase of polypeptide subunit release factors